MSHITTDQNTFTWFSDEGKVRSIEIGPNPYCQGWIPGSGKSLFSTSIGNDDYHFQLIDWTTGKRIWNIPCPGGGRQPLAVGLTRAFILFCVAEAYARAQRAANDTIPGIEEEWLRTFYAINMQDGSLVARWQAQFPRRALVGGREYFLQLSEKLFYVTPDEVTELKLDDIRSQRHGWQ